MQEYLYEVPVNGTRIPEMRKVIKETPKMYILEGIVDTRVRKSTMCNRFLRWFTHYETAKAYYNSVKFVYNS